LRSFHGFVLLIYKKHSTSLTKNTPQLLKTNLKICVQNFQINSRLLRRINT
jgi:hypothetical protein